MTSAVKAGQEEGTLQNVRGGGAVTTLWNEGCFNSAGQCGIWGGVRAGWGLSVQLVL